MKLKKHFLLFLGIVSGVASAQSRRVADRYFEEFSYVNAAELYEAIVTEKKDSSYHVLSRLADSYYNNSNIENAVQWYALMADKYPEQLSDQNLFRYAQSLRGVGKYKKSDSLFLALASKEGALQRDLVVKDEDYLLDLTNTEDKRIGVRNLALNTPYSDYGGFILNGKVYFASASPQSDKKQRLYKWNKQPFLNIYSADERIEALENERDTVLEMYNKIKFEHPISTEYHEGKPVFTKDGKTIYFTRNNFDGKRVSKDKKYTVNLKIYSAQMMNGMWINVKELPFNSDEYSVGHPALSPDEKFLYFVSNMPGGYGGSDLYRVAIDEQGNFSTPVNLGPTINTPDGEKFPFVGADNTLYFSSNGHVGLGLMDVFQSKIVKDTLYSKVMNLGAPFNSKKDDFAFYIDDKGKKGFFSSNRPRGKGDDDIYSFYIYEDVCTQTIKGTVVDNTSGAHISDAVVKLYDTSGNLVLETISDALGSYAFESMPCEMQFVIKASKFDHRPDQVAIQTTKESKKEMVSKLQLTPLIVGNQIVINPIYFDFNQAVIRSDAEYELENIVTVMKNHPEIVIKIEAHTDSRGNDAYNKRLSDKRAKATRDYLYSRGIDTSRIASAIGYGEEQLLNNCNNKNQSKCTEKEHQVNRRSYFYIVRGKEFIKVKQQAEKIKVRRRLSKKNSYLLFLKNNFKGGKYKNEKCFTKDKEKCGTDALDH